MLCFEKSTSINFERGVKKIFISLIIIIFVILKFVFLT